MYFVMNKYQQGHHLKVENTEARHNNDVILFNNCMAVSWWLMLDTQRRETRKSSGRNSLKDLDVTEISDNWTLELSREFFLSLFPT